MIKDENIPKIKQSEAKNPMLIRRRGIDSFAFSLSILLGRARNVIPNAFTKHAAARPPVNARLPAERIKIPLIIALWAEIPAKRLWNVSHSLTNPLNGGKPEIAIAPTRKKIAVNGISFMSPPYFSMFRVWVCDITEPAPKNNKDLKTAWFNV